MGTSRDDIDLQEKSDLIHDGEKATLDVGEGKAGFFLSVFNLMNAILGSGILGLAYAMAQLGIVMFFVICGGVAVLAFYAIILMLNMCKKTGAKVSQIWIGTFDNNRFFQAYETLGQQAFGDKGRYLVCACIFCQNMGAMSSYLFIIKTELPSVFKTIVCEAGDDLCLSPENSAWYFNGTYILLIVTGLVVIPLASLRHIGFLGYTSGFSISCMVFFTIFIVAKYFLHTEYCPLFSDAVASGGMVYRLYNIVNTKRTLQLQLIMMH